MCPTHGEFKQIAGYHLQGNGCPKCGGHGFIYLSYDEAKKYVRNLGIKSIKEYYEWHDKNKPDFLPKDIAQYYKKN